jgi:hypothetical protein
MACVQLGLRPPAQSDGRRSMRARWHVNTGYLEEQIASNGIGFK